MKIAEIGIRQEGVLLDSDVGQHETVWSDWEDCDVLSEHQVRTKLCMSPADTSGSGCTCEDYMKDYQACEGTCS